MQIKPVRLDTHFPRHLDGRTAADYQTHPTFLHFAH
jgi:hypothetical protein